MALLNLVQRFPEMRLTGPRPVGSHIWIQRTEESSGNSVKFGRRTGTAIGR